MGLGLFAAGIAQAQPFEPFELALKNKFELQKAAKKAELERDNKIAERKALVDALYPEMSGSVEPKNLLAIGSGGGQNKDLKMRREIPNQAGNLLSIGPRDLPGGGTVETLISPVGQPESVLAQLNQKADQVKQAMNQSGANYSSGTTNRFNNILAVNQMAQQNKAQPGAGLLGVGMQPEQAQSQAPDIFSEEYKNKFVNDYMKQNRQFAVARFIATGEETDLRKAAEDAYDKSINRVQAQQSYKNSQQSAQKTARELADDDAYRQQFGAPKSIYQQKQADALMPGKLEMQDLNIDAKKILNKISQVRLDNLPELQRLQMAVLQGRVDLIPTLEAYYKAQTGRSLMQEESFYAPTVSESTDPITGFTRTTRTAKQKPGSGGQRYQPLPSGIGQIGNAPKFNFR